MRKKSFIKMSGSICFILSFQVIIKIYLLFYDTFLENVKNNFYPPNTHFSFEKFLYLKINSKISFTLIIISIIMILYFLHHNYDNDVYIRLHDKLEAGKNRAEKG